jgi:hypothetical protein
MENLIIFFSTIFALIFITIYLRNEYKRAKIRNKKIMKSFAADNNFIFSNFLRDQFVREKKSNCFLSNTGDNQQIFNYIKGNYRGREIEIYNYEHHFVNLSSRTNPLGSIFTEFLTKEKDDIRYDYIVLELKTKKKLSKLLIAAVNSIDLGILPIASKYKGRLDTESNDFNKDFKLYLQKITNPNKIIALQVLTPDVMDFLLKVNSENDKRIIIEINDNTIILYKVHFLKSTEELKRLLKSFLTLVKEIEDNFK